jgi:7-keto-8-aminopelargonate synthetase-like enzyme
VKRAEVLAGLNPSHIAPVMVCDSVLCKQISDVLYGIYVRPINYPTAYRAAPSGCASLRRRTTAMPTSSIWCRRNAIYN